MLQPLQQGPVHTLCCPMAPWAATAPPTTLLATIGSQPVRPPPIDLPHAQAIRAALDAPPAGITDTTSPCLAINGDVVTPDPDVTSRCDDASARAFYDGLHYTSAFHLEVSHRPSPFGAWVWGPGQRGRYRSPPYSASPQGSSGLKHGQGNRRQQAEGELPTPARCRMWSGGIVWLRVARTAASGLCCVVIETRLEPCHRHMSPPPPAMQRLLSKWDQVIAARFTVAHACR